MSDFRSLASFSVWGLGFRGFCTSVVKAPCLLQLYAAVSGSVRHEISLSPKSCSITRGIPDLIGLQNRNTCIHFHQVMRVHLKSYSPSHAADCVLHHAPFRQRWGLGALGFRIQSKESRGYPSIQPDLDSESRPSDP